MWQPRLTFGALGLDAADSPSRDRRIDFVRGMALLVIFSDHVVDNPLSRASPYFVCYWDMSEVFVFVSGYVGGLSYWKTLTEDGWLQCQRRCLYRWMQIYAAHVAMLLFHILGFALCSRFIGASDYSVPDDNYVEFRHDPWASIIRIVSLQQRVAYFDILPIYLVFLPFLPSLLYLYSICTWLWPLIVVELYCLSLLLSLNEFLLPTWPWTLMPFAWQLLFFGAAFLALSKDIRGWIFPNGGSAVRWASIVFISLTVLRLAAPDIVQLARRDRLEPVRLIHFWSAVIIGRDVILRLLKPQNYRWTQPILLCGRNSLVTYCVGGVVANAVMQVPRASLGTMSWAGWAVAINLTGWSSCFLAALCSSKMRAGLLERKARRCATTNGHKLGSTTSSRYLPNG